MNFFEVPERRDRFCVIPGWRRPDGDREEVEVPLANVDAVIGNPPYVRQEHIPKREELKRQRGETTAAFEARVRTTKEFLRILCGSLWPGLKLSGRSDLHCYFWPVGAWLLKENGAFGFLTSSSWLDVEYGFPLQGWVLKHFKLVAVLESLDEPWFEDARVKTAVTILQRCEDEEARMSNVVKFVRFFKPLKEILGDRPHGDEAARQRAAEDLRRLILKTDSKFSNDRLRIIPIRQSKLWAEGVRAGTLLREQPAEGETEQAEEENGTRVKEAIAMYRIGSDYVAGKWGRFLRAPDIYFRLLEGYRDRFVRLGEIAEVTRGITSGCDAFFMPRDVTGDVLDQLKEGLPWNDIGLLTPCKRREVESGEVRIVQAGDNTLHPIESKFVRPEVHSLMQVDRPVIRTSDLNRVVLWVNEPQSELSHSYAGKYIRWGSRQTFASKKSKAVTVPLRSTCASRPVWYDLTRGKIGAAFWPKAQKYRHIIPTNPEGLVCNCNLYMVAPDLADAHERLAFLAILNSTIVGLFKCFYGRYAGSEGTLKTEVVDTILLEIPDPRGVSANLAERLANALESMSRRDVTHLVEDALLQCHSSEAMREILAEPPELPQELRQSDRRELDDCVFQLIGVKDKQRRDELIDELYIETTNYYRYQRTQDIQAMQDRAGKNAHRFGPQELASSIWHSLPDTEKSQPISDWLKSFNDNRDSVDIPEGEPAALGPTDMFNPNAVIFRSGRDHHEVTYNSSEQAALVAELARLQINGQIEVPRTATDCDTCLEQLVKRVAAAHERFTELAASRTGTQSLQEKTASLLMHWYIHGKS
jgi:Eco57I restriction-modification methylase